ncbi:hypothetical protein BH09MYX1_BH09MYX1_39010 [soil metagenome]
MKKTALVAVTISALAFASLGADGGCGSDAGSVSAADSGARDGSTTPNTDGAPFSAPRLVVVNALTEAGGRFAGVVVCAGKSGPFPQTTMPLTNHVGIPVGGGSDLGVGFAGTITLKIFDADQVAGEAKNCSSLEFNHPNDLTSISVTMTDAPVHVVALVTDLSQAQHVAAKQISLGEPSTFRPGFVQARFANVSNVAAPITLATGTASVAVSGSLASQNFEITLDSATKLTISGGAAFTQTLQSVQYATDPTSTTGTYFGERRSFFFALVGDPAIAFDPKASAQSLTGRELHLIAVPYGPGKP